MTLYRSPGQLSLFAHDSVNLGTLGGDAFTLLESDADSALLRPSQTTDEVRHGSQSSVGSGSGRLQIDQNAAIPVHQSGATPDSTPSASSPHGDVSLNTSATAPSYTSPSRAHHRGQGHSAARRRLPESYRYGCLAIIAGRDITYASLATRPEHSDGAFGDIFIDGPGTLDVWPDAMSTWLRQTGLPPAGIRLTRLARAERT